MPPKSIFRQPGTKNFQLVHRSQRDPLIYDPDASQHVLKEFERKNVKGKLSSFEEDSTAGDAGRAPGEAALFGIYFDDRDYDYTQHLRNVGVEESGVDSILLEAPSRPNKSSKKATFDLIPKEALPSQQEIPRTYDSGQAIESFIAGFQPDMDPHLRQTLEALDDEAFVDLNAEDDFFGELLAEGELEEGKALEFEFHEDGLREEGEVAEGEGDDWQSRFAKFKLEQKGGINAGSELDGRSEGGDTLGRLPSLSVAGAKKRRRKGTSDASGYSMNSSSMFRNEGLTRLDEQFERFEEEYASDNDEDENTADKDADSQSDASAPELTTREDFEAVLDDFLAQEQVGKKLQQKIGDTPLERLGTLRRALVDGEDENEARVRREALLNREDKDETPMPIPFDVDQRKERWDCETILTTYSNLENHPRLLRLTQPRGTKKIHLDSKTGLPFVEEAKLVEVPELSDSEDSEGDVGFAHTNIARPKDETAEEKKARKQAVKKERQERRKEKKGTKNMFSAERKQQSKVLSTREKAGVRKL